MRHCGAMTASLRARTHAPPGSFGPTVPRAAVLVLALLATPLLACPGAERPALESIERTTGTVSETLRIAIPVDNPSGVALRYRFEPSRPIPAIESVASISGSPSGGELRWTPLASHVGTHEIAIVIASPSGDEYDRATALVEILPASNAAPVFLEPGAGGTYDLAREPCVRFRVEIRDDDSPGVEIRARGELPTGASLTPDGGKSSDFAWCPEPDQIAAAERWTIGLEADDGDHPAVPHDYVVVLRSGGGTGCEGAAPVVTIVSPEGGASVTSGTGYDVVVTASDDVGLREPPILYWSTEAPSDPTRLDVTLFEQALFESEAGDGFRARVPSLGLSAGESREIFFVVSATDNDDPGGTACDQRTDTLLSSFFAVGGEGGALRACERCTASVECASGICAPSAGGARCLDACSGDACGGALRCAEVTTIEGGSTDACAGTGGSVTGACTAMCVNDDAEPNDTVAAATALSDTASGQICSGDRDLFRIAVDSPCTRCVEGGGGVACADLCEAGPCRTCVASGGGVACLARCGPTMSEVVLVLDGFTSGEGDLDLRILDAGGRILGSSAGVTDSETLRYCVGASGALYAEVFGYAGAQNAYDLALTVNPGGCCVNDALEPDDSVGAARAVVGTDFEGTLCFDDDDFRAFEVRSTSRVVIQVVADDSAVVDFELYDPSGALLARATDVGGTLTIDRTLSPGRYAVRVFGYMNAGDAYLGTVELSPAGPACSATRDCAAGQVCSSGSCISDDCTPGAGASCPAMHVCPDLGSASGPSDCATSCLVNADCRSGEACKWFAEGRGCARTGSGALGAACASFRDCSAQRTCVDLPGGFCTRAGCARNAECETGTFCAEVDGVRACALDCSTDMARCRSGYSCRAVTDVAGASRFACAP